MVEVTQGTVGVITFVSKDYAVVSVGAQDFFVFSQSKLYTSGIQFIGDMTRILDRDMEVNLSYDCSEPSQPFINAVWVGKNPTFFTATDTRTSTDLYDRQGFVIEEVDDSFLVELEGSCDRVLINKGMIKGLEEIEVAVVIKFDAVPIDIVHPSGARLRATSAWVGEDQPKLIDRFALEDEEDQFEEDQIIRGTVVVVPNDVVAFAHVDEKPNARVMLLHSSFHRTGSYKSVRECVSVGDVVFMKLVRGLIVPGRWQLYAERAWKDGAKYNDEPTKLSKEIEEAKSEVTNSNFVPDSRDKPAKRLPKKNSEMLYSDPPLQGPIYPYPDKAESALIRYGDYTISVRRRDVFIDGIMCEVNQFKSLVNTGENIVSFEAVRTRYSNCSNNLTHDATCVWTGRKPDLKDVVSSVSPSKLPFLTPNRTFWGQVCKYYLPNFAILLLKPEEAAVSLHVSAFGSEEYSCGGKSITKFASYLHKQLFECKLTRSPLFPDVVCAYDAQPCSKAEMQRRLAAASSPAPDSKPGHSDSDAYEAFPFTKTESQRKLLLDLPGVLNIVHKNGKGSIKIEHEFGVSVIDMDDPMLSTLNDNKRMELPVLKKLVGRPVRFDGEKQNGEVVVKRIWRPCSPRPLPEYALYSELKFAGNPMFLEGSLYAGTICSVPLHDAAVAEVFGVPVLVTLDSVAAEKVANSAPPTIDSYIKVNDLVALDIQQDRVKKSQKFFRAASCMKALKVKMPLASDKR